MAAITTTLRSPAQASDPMGDLYDANGNGLGLESGDAISFDGSLGGEPASNAPTLTFAEGPAGTTLQAVMDGIKSCLKLPERDGGAANLPSVSLNAAGSDDNIPDGSIVIRGQAGTASAVMDMIVRSTDSDNSKPSPAFFNTNMNATILQDATDDLIVAASETVYDASGGKHEATMTFSPAQTPSLWSWKIRLGGRETLLAGSEGRVAFGQDGAVAAFTFDGGGTRLEFDPGNGAEKVRVAVIAGGSGDFTGLSQFRSEATARFIGQNGCRAGTLGQISISRDGIISGSYSNGQSRSLFQIPLAEFPNKRGLKLIGENTFSETRESGVPVLSAAGRNSMGILAPGALEAAVD
jgi:flagellar hook-basal body protein